MNFEFDEDVFLDHLKNCDFKLTVACKELSMPRDIFYQWLDIPEFKEKFDKMRVPVDVNKKLYMRQYRLSHRNEYKGYFKEKLENFRLHRLYGIDKEIYDRMFSEQNGCCKICDRHQSECKRALAVDHCHKTNKVRGLLCNRCNHGLGYLCDDISILEKAVEYLKKSK